MGQIVLSSYHLTVIHKHSNNEEINIQVISAIYGRDSMEKNHTKGIMKRNNKNTRHRLVEKMGYI